MQQRTTPPTPAAAAGHDIRPVDVTVLRETARRLLDLGEVPPLVEDLAELTAMLRGQVELLIPEIQGLIATYSTGDVPAQVARIGIGEATRRLHAPQSPGTDGAYRYAKKFAMSVFSLCDHYENLHSPAAR